ncbi:histone deacetylase family protein [Marinigracilibium pacificum]|uniref:Histone deacetylase n=1 Tax=Marinigracilibium pacificum TaxID=2729599 RepID=A0A848J8C9_9BACT|nr:histone deacetylase [Marinigracilibium pacificum]NMM49322.1 histone deacetylase [Marinigracilibium pacificum]
MLKVAWAESYCHPLPEGHRFPMEKYILLPQQLLYEGTLNNENLFTPELPLDDELFSLVHSQEYINKLNQLTLSRSEERRTGFPLSESLIHREKQIIRGSVDATLFALKFGCAMNIAGGTHHAFSNKGEGFCLLNDIAVSAQYLVEYFGFKSILIVDLDVHQGNGTAEIFTSSKEVFTFSMHGKNNYPLHKEKSDLDIELEDGTGDKEYLALLDANLKSLVDRLNPEFIFFQSGVDVLKTDKLGRLGMSISGCKDRDRLVFEICKNNNIPVMVSMGGGYSEEIRFIIEAHANTYRLAQEIFF